MKKSILKYTLFLCFMGLLTVGLNSCSPKYGCPSLEGQADLESGKASQSSSGLFPENGKKGKKRKKNKK